MLLAPMLLVSCIAHGPAAPGETVGEDPSLTDATSSEMTTSDGTIIPPMVDLDALADENLASLPDADMEEAAFFILTTREETIIPTFGQEEEGIGRTIKQEILKRNQKIEEKYNIRILTIEESYDLILEKIESAYLGGVYLADLIELPSDLLGEFVDDRLAYNMNTLPFTDYTKSYFDAEAIASCSAGYSTFAVAGNANRYTWEGACVYFNASLIGKDASVFYDAVRRGEWTWDMLLSDAGNHAESLVILPEEFDMARLVLASGDADLVTSAYGSYPEAKEKNAVQACVDVVTRLAVLADREKGFDDFKSGNALYYIGYPTEYEPLTNAAFSWGMLPLPKTASSQEEYTTVSSYQTVYVTIKTMASPDRSGMVLQALNAATTGQIGDAIRSDLWLNAAQSADAPNMLSYFMENHHYEFGHNFSIGYDSIRRVTLDAYAEAIAGKGSFAERYAEDEENLLYWNPRNFG